MRRSVPAILGGQRLGGGLLLLVQQVHVMRGRQQEDHQNRSKCVRDCLAHPAGMRASHEEPDLLRSLQQHWGMERCALAVAPLCECNGGLREGLWQHEHKREEHVSQSQGDEGQVKEQHGCCRGCSRGPAAAPALQVQCHLVQVDAAG